MNSDQAVRLSFASGLSSVIFLWCRCRDHRSSGDVGQLLPLLPALDVPFDAIASRILTIAIHVGAQARSSPASTWLPSYASAPDFGVLCSRLRSIFVPCTLSITYVLA
jgi:hypothetical protein